jgi:hypothetical protein
VNEREAARRLGRNLHEEITVVHDEARHDSRVDELIQR